MTRVPSLYTTAEIAAELRGELIGDGSVQISGFSAADRAREGDLTFADQERHLFAAEQSKASAILVAGVTKPSHKVLIRVADPRVAMARVLPLFFSAEKHAPGIHPSSVVDTTAQVDSSAHIGPHCVVREGVHIGAGSVLMGGNQIGADSQIGQEVCLHPNVVIYPRSQIGNRVTIHAGTVIGSDGYGYVLDEGRHRKMMQTGFVAIHDDVEIGANTAIDRGTFGPTVIGEGTKIDNLVHVAHNVLIGRHCLILGQVGFAGSTRLEDYCVIASQAGIAGHLKLGPKATVGAKSGVMRDVPPGETVLGIPAATHHQAKRQFIALKQLPDLLRRLRELEEQINALKKSE